MNERDEVLTKEQQNRMESLCLMVIGLGIAVGLTVSALIGPAIILVETVLS